MLHTHTHSCHVMCNYSCTDDEKDGFHMRVENGSKPENGTVCKNGMMSEVILTCDKNAPWNNQDISNYVELAYHHGSDPCMVSYATCSMCYGTWFEHYGFKAGVPT